MIARLLGVLLFLASFNAMAVVGYVTCLSNPGTGVNCTVANKRWVLVSERPPTGSFIRGNENTNPYTWFAHDYVGTIKTQECSDAVINTGTCNGITSYVVHEFTSGGVTCTAPLVDVSGTCVPCGTGTYYSGGSCVAEPTCTPPQVLDPVGHVCVTPTVTCTPPQVLDVPSNTCITPENTVICIPAARTVEPCPGGYAPNTITISSALTPDPYTSVFDRLPVQDMLYSMGVAICALLGIGVGARLV